MDTTVAVGWPWGGHGAVTHSQGDLQPTLQPQNKPAARCRREATAWPGLGTLPFFFFTHFLPDGSGSFFLPPSPPTLGLTHFNSNNN